MMKMKEILKEVQKKIELLGANLSQTSLRKDGR